jgi:hypothetical protein
MRNINWEIDHPKKLKAYPKHSQQIISSVRQGDATPIIMLSIYSRAQTGSKVF